MTEFLRRIVAWATRAHDVIMTINDRYEYRLSDKQLHFIIIGAMGLALLGLVYPLFRRLSRHRRVLAISWIYVLTVLVAVTFAIEIGQRVTGTGYMEFGDIVAGLGGFFAVTAVILAAQCAAWLARTALGSGRKKRRQARPAQY